MRPLKTTLRRPHGLHLGPHPHLDGKKWNMARDWYQADDKVIGPLIKEQGESTWPTRSTPAAAADCGLQVHAATGLDLLRAGSPDSQPRPCNGKTIARLRRSCQCPATTPYPRLATQSLPQHNGERPWTHLKAPPP